MRYVVQSTAILGMSDSYNITEFSCAMCGNCCRGEGYVRVTPEDIGQMAALLKISVAEFQSRYTRTPEITDHSSAGDLWLLDKPGPEMDCIFLENNRCQVHASKPVQCIGFPLKWRTPDVTDYCVGMQR
ncbi:MAG: YkgJ family cysteine cluster protein [Candidatus Sumerlaeaceae bacterium]